MRMRLEGVKNGPVARSIRNYSESVERFVNMSADE
jgi:hypothetical protein